MNRVEFGVAEDIRQRAKEASRKRLIEDEGDTKGEDGIEAKRREEGENKGSAMVG
jgi:hypothetical protein